MHLVHTHSIWLCSNFFATCELFFFFPLFLHILVLCIRSVFDTSRCFVAVDAEYERRAVITALVSVFSVAVIIVITFTAVRVYLMQCHSSEPADDSATDTAAFLAGCDSISATSRSTSSDLDGLKVDQLISHGRYGDVYRGLLGGSEVAVKVIILFL